MAVPVSPIPTLLGSDPGGGGQVQQGMSPEQIKFMREYAKLFMNEGNAKQPYPFGPWNGAKLASDKVLGALFARQAFDAERDSVKNFNRAASDYTFPSTGAGGPGGKSNTAVPFPGAPQGPPQGPTRDLVPPQPGASGPLNPSPKQGSSQSTKPSTPGASGRPDPSQAMPEGMANRSGSLPQAFIDDTKGVIEAYKDHINRTKGAPPDKVKLAYANTGTVSDADPSPGMMPTAEGSKRPNPGNIVPNKEAKAEEPEKKEPEKKEVKEGPVALSPEQVAQATPNVASGLNVLAPGDRSASIPGLPPMLGQFLNPASVMAPNQGLFKPPAPTNSPIAPQQVPNSPFGAQPLPSGQFQKETADAMYRMSMARGDYANPEEMKRFAEFRLGMMPKKSVDPTTGFIRSDEPGREPRLILPSPGEPRFNPSLIERPGFPYPFKPRFDANGQIIGIEPVPIVPPAGTPPAAKPNPRPFSTDPNLRSGAIDTGTPSATPTPAGVGTPPASSPTGPVTPATPPVVPPRATAGAEPPVAPGTVAPANAPTQAATLMGSPVPQGQRSIQVASADPHQAAQLLLAQEPVRDGRAGGLDVGTDIGPKAARPLATSNPPPEVWTPFLDEAFGKKPARPAEYLQPDPYETDPKIAALYNENKGIYKDAATAVAKDDMKEMSKRLASFHDSGQQARKQMASIKMMKHMMADPQGFALEQGELAPYVTKLRNIRQELGRWGERHAKDKDADPWVRNLYKEMGTWANQPGGEANDVLMKNLAALTLENLRSMLGPNSGQFRQYEMILMRQAMGDQIISPGAQRTIMNMIDRLNDRVILYDEMATAWHEHGGQLDDRFMGAVRKFDLANPMYQPDEFDELIKPKAKSPGQGGTPGGQPSGITDKEVIMNGKTYILRKMPDGSVQPLQRQ